MKQYLLRLHLTIEAESAQSAQRDAIQLGEMLADAVENWTYPARLIALCIDNPEEVTEERHAEPK